MLNTLLLAVFKNKSRLDGCSLVYTQGVCILLNINCLCVCRFLNLLACNVKVNRLCNLFILAVYLAVCNYIKLDRLLLVKSLLVNLGNVEGSFITLCGLNESVAALVAVACINFKLFCVCNCAPLNRDRTVFINRSLDSGVNLVLALGSFVCSNAVCYGVCAVNNFNIIVCVFGISNLNVILARNGCFNI